MRRTFTNSDEVLHFLLKLLMSVAFRGCGTLSRKVKSKILRRLPSLWLCCLWEKPSAPSPPKEEATENRRKKLPSTGLSKPWPLFSRWLPTNQRLNNFQHLVNLPRNRCITQKLALRNSSWRFKRSKESSLSFKRHWETKHMRISKINSSAKVRAGVDW